MFWLRKMTLMWKCWNTQQNHIPFLRHNTLPSLKHDDAPVRMVKHSSLHQVLIVLSFCMCLHILSHDLICIYVLVCSVWLFVTPWTVAHQAPLSMGFSRQEFWSRFPVPSPEDLRSPGTESTFLQFLYWGWILHPLSHQGSLTSCKSPGPRPQGQDG